jgi:hypothetical protein
VHGHTNICYNEEDRKYAKELSKNRAQSAIDEIDRYAKINGTSGREHNHTKISAFGHGDEHPVINDGAMGFSPESAPNMRVDVGLQNPEVFKQVLDRIQTENQGWTPVDGFAVIGCPNVGINGSELTHKKFSFEDRSAELKDIEAVHELGTVIRYLDLECHKMNAKKQATPFKLLHKVHDHLGHLAHEFESLRHNTRHHTIEMPPDPIEGPSVEEALNGIGIV